MTDKKITEEECLAAFGGHCWDEGVDGLFGSSFQESQPTRKCRHCWKQQKGHYPEKVIWEDA